MRDITLQVPKYLRTNNKEFKCFVVGSEFDRVHLWSLCDGLVEKYVHLGMDLLCFNDCLLGHPISIDHVPPPCHWKISRYPLAANRDDILWGMDIILSFYCNWLCRQGLLQTSQHFCTRRSLIFLLCGFRSLWIWCISQVEWVESRPVSPRRKASPTNRIFCKRGHLIFHFCIIQESERTDSTLLFITYML